LITLVFMLSLAAATPAIAADLPQAGFLVFRDRIGAPGAVLL
jgi:hypothetical protein